MRIGRGSEQCIVTIQRYRHRLGMLLPQPRRALIGEQERHGPRRRQRHRPNVTAARRFGAHARRAPQHVTIPRALGDPSRWIQTRAPQIPSHFSRPRTPPTAWPVTPGPGRFAGFGGWAWLGGGCVFGLCCRVVASCGGGIPAGEGNGGEDGRGEEDGVRSGEQFDGGDNEDADEEGSDTAVVRA